MEPAAIPETYTTAWTCLFRNLELRERPLIAIRGATPAFGQAAVKLVVNAGASLIATSGHRERFAMLEALRVERCEIERLDLSKHVAKARYNDAVLDLAGNRLALD